LALALFAWAEILHAQDAPDSLTISRAVEQALAQNPTIRAAREEVSAAKARISAARAGLLPNVSAEVQHTRVTNIPSFEIPSLGPGIPPREVTAAAADNTIGLLAARQSLYTGGRTRAQVSRAEALYDLALARLGTAEAEIAFQTREAYYAFLLSRSLVASAEKDLAAAGEQLSSAQAKLDAGTAPRFDVLRAETQVSEAEQRLAEAKSRVEIAAVALNRLIGTPLGESHTLVEAPLSPAPEESLASLIETAGRQRAELLAARAQSAAAEAGIRLARSARLPQVGLSANYQVVAEETPAQTTGWTFIASIGLEVFDGGRIRANIKESQTLRNEARFNLEDAERAVEQEVRREYLNLQTARGTLETAKARLAQAQEAYDVATVRYESGVGTAVELADALAALAAARTNQDQATFNYNTAYAGLQRALGRSTY
jgi:outer membrane protein TolC